MINNNKWTRRFSPSGQPRKLLLKIFSKISSEFNSIDQNTPCDTEPQGSVQPVANTDIFKIQQSRFRDQITETRDTEPEGPKANI